VILRIPASA